MKADFKISESQAFQEIERLMTQWMENADEMHQRSIVDSDPQMRQEALLFRSNRSVAQAICCLAEQARINQENRPDYQFFLCAKNLKIQGVLVVSKHPSEDESLENPEKYLEISYLVTNPINMRSSLTDQENFKDRVKGAGSALLQFAEQLAAERKLGICLESTDCAQSFYAGHHYHPIENSRLFIKTNAEIVNDFAISKLDFLKIS